MLILAEKPSVAKEFARALHVPFANGFYRNDAFTVTNCVGHLFELSDPEDYDPALKAWSADTLPIVPAAWKWKPIPAVKAQKDLVIRLLKEHKTGDILIATDADREGEYIARLALQEAGISDTSRIRRFWVSEALTDEVIKRGMDAAKTLASYDALAAQGASRAKADWLVGINLTRFVSIGQPSTFHIGRVQTALLAAVAQRNADAAAFKPLPFKELKALMVSDAPGSAPVSLSALLVNPKTQKTAFFEADCPYLEKAVEEAPSLPLTAEAETARKTKKPDKLFNLTALQKTAYKRFGFPPDKTLAIVQKCYEDYKCLSYPRTPSRVMGEENVELFRATFSLLKDSFPELSAFCDGKLISKSNRHIFNDSLLEGHHALIPLDALPGAASEDERRIYSTVCGSFFTACMPDYVYDEKRITFHAGGYVFTAAIRDVLQMGFMASRKNDAGGDGEEEDAQEVSGFDETAARISGFTVNDKQTSPPKEFSIDTLLAFMENPKNEAGEKLSGLGTPATRAEIIKKLMDPDPRRNYVIENSKKLYATRKGLFLLSLLKKDKDLALAADPATTTQWEQQLADDPASFLKEIEAYVRLCVKKTAPPERFQRDEKKPLGPCPLCGKPVFDGKASYYCSGYKEGGCKFAIWKTSLSGASFSPSDAAALLAGRPTKTKKWKTKAGKECSTPFTLKDGKLEPLFQDPRQ